MDPAERFGAIIDAIAARIPEVGHGSYRDMPAGQLGGHVLFVFDGAGTRFRLTDSEDPGEWTFVGNDDAMRWVDHAWQAITHARG